MTASTITSILKYIEYKRPVAGRTGPLRAKPKPALQPAQGDLNSEQPESNRSTGDRYAKTIKRYAAIEHRLNKQNQIALTVRDTDHTMQQIAIRIEKMKNALKTIVSDDGPSSPGSDTRMVVLKMVSDWRHQIEQLSLPAIKHDDPQSKPARAFEPALRAGTQPMATADDKEADSFIRRITTLPHSARHLIPSTDSDASGAAIKASIVQLNKSRAFIRNQRNQLISQTLLIGDRQEGRIGIQDAESKSLFIGKHLGQQPDKDLTTTTFIFRGFLD